MAQLPDGRTYVVEWNEPAMYYGAKTGVIDPGTDCPDGHQPGDRLGQGSGGRRIYTRRGSEVAAQSREPDAQPGSWSESNGVPRQGPRERLCESDFDARPGAGRRVRHDRRRHRSRWRCEDRLHEPDGEQGIDNNFYKTLGCWKTYRGPPRLSSGALQFNDSMRNGAWTTVIVVAGKGNDPMNDKHVDVGFYLSDDKMVKDGNGAIARDYTFRIQPQVRSGFRRAYGER